MSVTSKTVYYKVYFTCNIYFLKSTYFIFNKFKSNRFRVSLAVEYIMLQFRITGAWDHSVIKK